MRLRDRAISTLDSVNSAKSALRLLRRFAGRLGGGYILAFHSISVGRFLEHVNALEGEVPVSIDEMMELKLKGQSTAGLFAITFDDGYADTVPAIAESAIARNIPVTFYLPVKYLETGTMLPLVFHRLIASLPSTDIAVQGSVIRLSEPSVKVRYFRELRRAMYTRNERAFRPVLDALIDAVLKAKVLTETQIFDVPRPVTWNQVKELSRHRIISFQSHGMSHQSVVSLEEEELRRELLESKDAIEQHTKIAVNHFCYPYGGRESIGECAPGVVRKYYQSAVTMMRGRVGNSNPWFLPRIPLYERDSAAVAGVKVLTR